MPSKGSLLFPFSILILSSSEDAKPRAEAAVILNHEVESAWVPNDCGAIIPAQDDLGQHLCVRDETSMYSSLYYIGISVMLGQTLG